MISEHRYGLPSNKKIDENNVIASMANKMSALSVENKVLINIYHKCCGTIGVPLFASENIKLAINFKKYRR